MQILVIGATGYIGSNVYNEIIKREIDVLGTACNAIGTRFMKFKLGEDSTIDAIEKFTDADKTAIICAAVSNIDKCKSDYKMAYRVNVTATRELVDQLHARGFHIIYFSSDNVFDGKRGNYGERDMVNPLNAYGCMKVEMEQYLQEHIPDSCIFRLAKVVDSEINVKNMFFGWEQQCYKTVYCFKNNILTCIAMEDVVNACLLAIKHKLAGIYHLSSDIAIRRDILVKQFFDSLGIRDYVIEEKEIERFRLLEKRPLNTSLNNHKFKSVADYHFLSMEELMIRYAANRNKRLKKE